MEIFLGETLTPAKAKRLALDKRFFADLQDQALHDLGTFPYVDTSDCTDPLDPNELIVFPSPEVNPFRPDGKCACSRCMTAYADDFARSVGLYSDVVVLPDTFSQTVLHTSPDCWTPPDLMAWTTLLGRLEPLMRGGVIRFSRWIYSRCRACGSVGKQAVDRVSSRLLDDAFASPGLSLDWGIGGKEGVWPEGEPWVGIHSPILTGPVGPIVLRARPTKAVWKVISRSAPQGGRMSASAAGVLSAFLKRRLLNEFRMTADSAVFSISMSRASGASLLTDSLLGSRVLSYLDDLSDSQGHRHSEMTSVRELPWIPGLDAAGVMEVRQAAKSALPSFRAFLRSAAFSEQKTRGSALHDLRAGVAEVENELEALRLIKRRAHLLPVAGVLFAVAGFGTRQPATILAGLAGFLSTLAAAHGSATTTELREHGLMHKPAYLLLKAKEASRQSHLREAIRKRPPSSR